MVVALMRCWQEKAEFKWGSVIDDVLFTDMWLKNMIVQCISPFSSSWKDEMSVMNSDDPM